MKTEPRRDSFVILGSGGGGRTAASIIEAACSKQGPLQPRILFLDDAERRASVNGYPVVGPVARALDENDELAGAAFVVAFGSTHLPARERVFAELRSMRRRMLNAVHPSVVIDRWASVGIGNVISAQCAIHPNAKVGDNCFFCLATTVDHDDEVGDNVYFSPGVHLAGGVVVEANVFIGTGAVVLPGVRIRQGAVIGAGAVVTKDVGAGVTVVGVPARPVLNVKEVARK